MPMFVGICQVELLLPQAQSLKDKRFVLSSVKTRIGNKFNVSIAEVDQNDLWQRATLGLSLVSNERKHVDQVFTKILNLLSNEDQLEIIKHQLEVV